MSLPTIHISHSQICPPAFREFLGDLKTRVGRFARVTEDIEHPSRPVGANGHCRHLGPQDEENHVVVDADLMVVIFDHLPEFQVGAGVGLCGLDGVMVRLDRYQKPVLGLTTGQSPCRLKPTVRQDRDAYHFQHCSTLEQMVEAIQSSLKSWAGLAVAC